MARRQGGEGEPGAKKVLSRSPAGPGASEHSVGSASQEPIRRDIPRKKSGVQKPGVQKPGLQKPGITAAVTNDGGATGLQDEFVRVDLGARARERRRARGRLLLARGTVALFVALLVVGAAWVVLVSGVTALDPQRVVVAGEKGERAEKVAAVADAYAGVPLLRVPVGRVEEEVAALPRVQDVGVARSWPRGLKISVTPRKPVMAEKVGKKVNLLGPDGVKVTTVKKVPKGLPLVALDGDTPQEERQLLAADAYRVWEDLPKSVQQQVETLVANPSGLLLLLRGGQQAVWGESGEDELKAEVLTLLLERGDAKTYDVSNPRRPVSR